MTFSTEAPGHTSQAPGHWPEDPWRRNGRHQTAREGFPRPKAARTASGPLLFQARVDFQMGAVLQGGNYSAAMITRSESFPYGGTEASTGAGSSPAVPSVTLISSLMSNSPA